jgi:hypothetical protein
LHDFRVNARGGAVVEINFSEHNDCPLSGGLPFIFLSISNEKGRIGSQQVFFKPTLQPFFQATAAGLRSSEPPLEFRAQFVACLSRTNEVQSRSPFAMQILGG